MKKISENIKSIIDVIKFCIKLTYMTSKKYFFLHLIIDIFSIVIPFAGIYFSSKLIDILSDNYGISHNGSGMILKLFIIFVIVMIFLQGCGKGASSLKSYLEGMYNEKLSACAKRQIMDKAGSLDMKNFDMPEFFDTLNDVDMNSSMIIFTSFQVFALFKSSIHFIIAFVNTALWNWYLPFIIIVTLIPSVIINNKQMSSLYAFQKENMKYDRKMYYLTDLTVNRDCAQDVRMYSLIPFIRKRFDNIWNDVFCRKRKIVLRYTLLLIFFDMLPLLVAAVFLIVLGMSVFNGKTTVGEFNMYQGFIAQAMDSMFMVIYSLTQIYDGKIRVTNYKKFLELESDTCLSGDKEFIDKEFKIEFRNVTFRYNEESEDVLKNVSFMINSKEKLALVGTNGSGKTTVIKLLLRMYEPTDGEILINGVDIHEYSIESIRKCFSPMFQNYFNYAFTAKEDILISDLKYENDSDKIKKASEKSGAALFINEFSDKLDTYLTRQYEDGEELSGGQWQKIALSRTFFREAELYILDEPSSALDAESEDQLFRQFEELYKNKGAILISHRLSNVKNCDRIIVIDNGEIVEEGTHHELIALDKKYAHLFNLQAEKYL